MLDWKSEHGQIEAQVNTFASFLLMPLDDFWKQIRSQEITMALMRHLSDRYEGIDTLTGGPQKLDC